MASFASDNSRIHKYSGPISSSDTYLSEKVNSIKPIHVERKNATLSYLSSGGGVPLKGNTKTNMGRVRLNERSKIDADNLRTHDRLSKITSTIPSQRTKPKPTKVKVIEQSDVTYSQFTSNHFNSIRSVEPCNRENAPPKNTNSSQPTNGISAAEGEEAFE